jgi:zinc transport system permease protein
MITFIEIIFNSPIFYRAVVAGALISLILSWFGGYIVLRREVLFTHSLSNIGFLGVALAILFSLPVTPMLILACLLAAFLIIFLQKKQLFNNDSLLGIFSQLGLALSIIVISFFEGYQINLEQFLFGDILAISRSDFRISILTTLLTIFITLFAHKNFLKISISKNLSHTLVKHKTAFHYLLVFVLASLIALAINIIGVLLVAAFTTIPANTAKLFAKSLRQTFIFSALIGFLATFFGIWASFNLDLPSGPTIVATLGILWVLAIFYNRFTARTNIT